ncbi:hypothetical protein QTP88_008870 [Uroleucon formosanum]
MTPPQNIIYWSTEKQEEILSQHIVINKTIQKTIETPTTTEFKKPSSDTNKPKSPTYNPQYQTIICLPLSPTRKKVRTYSRSDSLSSKEDNKIDAVLNSTVVFFTDSKNTSIITLDHFKCFLKNV